MSRLAPPAAAAALCALLAAGACARPAATQPAAPPPPPTIAVAPTAAPAPSTAALPSQPRTAQASAGGGGGATGPVLGPCEQACRTEYAAVLRGSCGNGRGGNAHAFAAMDRECRDDARDGLRECMADCRRRGR